MRKYLPFLTMVLVAIAIYTQNFKAQESTSIFSAFAMSSPFEHERVDSEKAQRMKSFFVSNGAKNKHEFTKFDRLELIAALEAMPQMDTVKFIIGAFTNNEGRGRDRGHPVIMLQLVNNSKPIPGGAAETYMYLQGGICPPPNGVCSLE